MKLKNKKTGKMIETVIVDHGAEWEIRNMYTDEDAQIYNSLAELNEEWEDAPEEPKEYWYLENNGEVVKTTYECNLYEEKMQEIGNYFDTRKEAEKAVEKLKALTEAKEDGLKIKGYYYNHEDLVILADIGKCNKLTLDTLFGKEID